MKKERLELLPILLDKYKDKISVDVAKGTFEGLKVYRNHKGYLTVNFWYEGTSKYYRVHEIISYIGGLDLLDNTVNHINGNKTDNRLSNLETISALENHKKAKDTKSFLTGADNHASKLSESQVRAIRAEYTGKYGEQSALARKYGVHQTTIYQIVSGKCWRDLDNNEEETA